MAFTILVVDDHEIIARMYAKLLNSLGCETIVAFSGDEAFRILKTKKPKIIFLDINMSVMNGYEIASKIKSNEEFSQIILTALTARGKTEDRLKARHVGFDHYLEKPASLADLKRIVDVHNY